MASCLDEMASPKVREFVAELESLCRQHGFQLAPQGYDALQVWRLEPGEEPLYFPLIEDKTEE